MLPCLQRYSFSSTSASSYLFFPFPNSCLIALDPSPVILSSKSLLPNPPLPRLISYFPVLTPDLLLSFHLLSPASHQCYPVLNVTLPHLCVSHLISISGMTPVLPRSFFTCFPLPYVPVILFSTLLLLRLPLSYLPRSFFPLLSPALPCLISCCLF